MAIDKKLTELSEVELIEACKMTIGPIDSNFLCRSLSVLNPPDPLTIPHSAAIAEACQMLKQNSIGCVLVVDAAGKLCGVFSERDYMSKVYNSGIDVNKTGIATVMTPDPFTVAPNSPIAYCLTLMSEGGFRHLPMVDPDHMPIGLVSVRDVINYIVEHGIKGLLAV